MSNQFPTQPEYAPYNPAPVPPKPSKLKRFGLPVGLLALGLVVGGSAGASAVPEPVETVKEVPVEKIVTKTVTETPASCLSAIDYAEQVIESSGRAIGVMADMFEAAANLNAAEINRLSPKIDTETEVLTGLKPKYQSARDSCQASR